MSMVTEAPLRNAVPTDQELIDFVVREARLIDQQRFDEWLDMYADDAFYWMPLEWNQTDQVRCCLRQQPALCVTEEEGGPAHGDRERRQYRHWRGDRPRTSRRGLCRDLAVTAEARLEPSEAVFGRSGSARCDGDASG